MRKQEEEKKVTFSYKLECPACHNKTKVVKQENYNKYGEYAPIQIKGPEYYRVSRWQRYDKCRRWIHTWFCGFCGYMPKLEE